MKLKNRGISKYVAMLVCATTAVGATGIVTFADTTKESARTAQTAYTKKQVTNINEGWDFTSYTGSEEKNITLPHSWEGPAGMVSKTSTYEKSLDVADYNGKKIFLKFYGVNKNLDLYVNGMKIATDVNGDGVVETDEATHIGGFSSFVVDITDYIVDGKAQIKAEVTNFDLKTMPLNTDFTHFAGIYRDVELVVTDNVYIATEDHGSTGVYVTPAVDLANNSATIDVKTMISADAERAETFTVRAVVKDAAGEIVGETKKDVLICPGEQINQAVILPTVAIENPTLWNGMENPYLYTVDVEVLDRKNRVVDAQSQRIGIRDIKVDKTGFYLNGNLYPLRGVGFHQDRDGLGNAVSTALKEEDMAMIAEIGANAIRTAHYPHDQAIYDMADEMGLIVWNEIPFYLLMADTQLFTATAKEQLLEMIKQGYNHPSIAVWGIQNEVNTDPAYANFGADYAVDADTLGALMQELATLAKDTDSTRYVAQAVINNNAKAQETKGWTVGSDIDLTAFNLYPGWYSSYTDANGNYGHKVIRKSLVDMMGAYKKLFSDIPFALSEYGAGANVTQHAVIDENFVWNGSASSKGDFHPEEYQNVVHEAVYSKIADDDTIWASFAWAMFEFSSYRNEGGQLRLNDKGLVTYNRETKKDAFYFYKANWNKEDKFAYITSRRFVERTDATTDVKVYSNCESVTLEVNGVDYGFGMKQQDGVFVWKDIALNGVGEANTVVATGISNGKSYTDRVTDWVVVEEVVEPEVPVDPEEPTYPEYPVTPEYPTYPEYPVTPEYPTYPEYPVTPEYPTYPEYPVTPEYLTYPEYPEYPVTPEESTTEVVDPEIV